MTESSGGAKGVQRIEISRACAYYAAANYGEDVGYGDSHQESVADLLSKWGGMRMRWIPG